MNVTHVAYFLTLSLHFSRDMITTVITNTLILSENLLKHTVKKSGRKMHTGHSEINLAVIMLDM